MFKANVAVEDQDEIVHDSSCILAHSQGTFCRVVDFRINTTAPAVDLCRVHLKTGKTTLHIKWNHMLVSCSTNLKHTNAHDSYSYLLRRTAVKLLLRHNTENLTLWNHIFELH